ncbi:hypothetical protein F5B19DRAFT_191885 [Rostrohypoxylon terebratum]|nr:hypothetical protein F5B19DRAFT_191885 [Rostrohypoxylon terebratum]
MTMELNLRPLPNPTDDIWGQNEPRFRELYEVERKTLKEVKQIMETQYDFPIHSQSTYETKLKHRLKLRKKLKKEDWAAVYHHCLARDGKDTGVYLNGTRIPREKVWKEIRRSGARSARKDQHTRLPAHIRVRTPSPVREPIAPRPLPIIQEQSLVNPNELSVTSYQAPFTSHALVGHKYGPRTTFQPSHVYQHQYASIHNQHWVSGTAASLQLVLGENVVALRDIPWVVFNSAMFCRCKYKALLIHFSAFASKLDHDPTENIMGDLFSAHSSAALECMPSSPLLSFLRDLDPRPAPYISTWNINVYHLVAEAIYQISNNHLGDGTLFDCPEIIQLLLKRPPRAIFLELFRGDLPTIRSVWEVLAWRAGFHGYKDAFILLMEVGLWHSDWIFPRGHFYLASAVSIGVSDAIQSLLKVGVRADGDIQHDFFELPAIVEAFATGNIECADLLLRVCDIHRIVCIESGVHGYFFTSEWSVLGIFLHNLIDGPIMTCAKQDHTYPPDILRIDREGSLLIDFNLENEARSRIFDMVLDHGADVDSKYLAGGGYHCAHLLPRDFFSHVQFHPTILEMSYYKDPKLFDRLDSFSSHAIGRVTRPGICLSAKQGSHALLEYLTSESTNTQFDTTSFLELVLVEQFLCNRARIDIEVVRGLIESGVDPNLVSLPVHTNYLLYLLIEKIQEYENFGEYVVIIKLLLQSGLKIDSRVLEAGVEKTGINILRILSCYDVDIARIGATALVAAACLDNYEAVSWLIEVGVDVNATIQTNVGSRSNILVLACAPRKILDLHREESLEPASCKMLEYLIDRGAVIINNPHGSNVFDCLHRLLSIHEGVSPDRLKLLLRMVIDHNDLLKPGECLLEAVFDGGSEMILDITADNMTGNRLATFEILLRRGALTKYSRVLGSLILSGGRHELIEEVLNAGVDINAYSSMGKDYDDFKSYITPIQAAAFRGDKFLVDKLIQKGAGVNHPGMEDSGGTALQFVCRWQPATPQEKKDKLVIVQLLIDNGADVNAPAVPDGGTTALQAAAGGGDLETALLLIRYGADPNIHPDASFRMSALEAAVHHGRLDMVKFLLNVGALSWVRGRTGYRGAIFVARNSKRIVFIDLIREHVRSDFQVIGANLAVSFQDETEAERELPWPWQKLQPDEKVDAERELDEIESEMMGYCP